MQPVEQPQKENAFAIVSLVLGIISIVGGSVLTGVPAIITGILGMRNPHNKGLALAGLIMGTIATVLTLLAVLAFFLFLFIIAAAGSQAAGSEFDPRNPNEQPSSSQQRSI